MSGKKRITIMLIPHWGKGPGNFRISLGLTLSLVILVLIFFTSLGFLSRDYIRVQEKNQVLAKDLHRLERIKALQDYQLEYYARESREMAGELEEIIEMDREVRELLQLEEFQEKEPDLPDEGHLSRRKVHPSRSSLSPAEEIPREADLVGGPLPEEEYPLEDLGELRSLFPSTLQSLEELESLLKEEKDRIGGTPSLWPLQGRLTSPFGYRSCPFTGRRRFHQGIDLGAPWGTPVHATGGGVVESAQYKGGFGNTVIINHPYGHTTWYAHLADYQVKEGEEVKKGEVIGYVGSTGFSTGPHLHYEVHQEGSPVDPMDFIPQE